MLSIPSNQFLGKNLGGIFLRQAVAYSGGAAGTGSVNKITSISGPWPRAPHDWVSPIMGSAEREVNGEGAAALPAGK